ncbi:MAG TPA: glutamate racemase [Ktedonobacteraceae bacterium]|nr:glutamate racemase [Ktedonobacteraceae bacterium]
MKIWGFEDEAEIRDVYPARDAERSEHTFNDNSRGDPRLRPLAYLRQLEMRQQQSTDLARAPIGVFDSGAGGLTILSSLRQRLPHEDYIYLGDTAHCPYGTRSEAEITELSLQACRFLIEQGVKLIVVACNTASQAALATLRATYPAIPFIGVVPAVKPASRMTKRGRIGIAATNRASKAAYLRQLIDDYASGLQVYAVGCPELVTLVEAGQLEGPEVEETLRHSFAPLITQDVDVIVLGCTHFPALRSAIERVVGPQVQVIDSGSAIGRRTHSVLDTEGLLYPDESHEGALQIWCSGDAQHFSEVASKVLGLPITACNAHI